MSYNANVYNIMIASPSDVADERNIAKEVILSWNTLNSEKMNVVLLPIGWETHSSPLMGGRAQGIINNQVTDKSDLLIGIFWTRIGTKTGDFESGTIEEIERHINSDKPAMLYFSNSPVRPDSIDNEQYQKLQEFKTRCLKRGLVESFDSGADFREKLKNQLALTIDNNNYFIKSTNTESIVPENLNIYDQMSTQLPAEAKNLLIDCAKSESSILLIEFSGDRFIIQSNKSHTYEGQRELAKWRSILKKLESYELISDNSYKGKSFSLTNKGYEFAEFLEGINVA